MHTISRRRSLVAVVFLTIAAQAVAQPTLDAIASHFPFREIGPTRQGGRVVAFGVTAGDPYRFFVGAGPGGLWRTINNGTSFEPVFDREGAASIGDVAVAPSRPEVVWVGTGEANLRNSTYYGNGVYRSTDGGETWTHRGLEETHHIGRVRIHLRDEHVDVIRVVRVDDDLPVIVGALADPRHVSAPKKDCLRTEVFSAQSASNALHGAQGTRSADRFRSHGGSVQDSSNATHEEVRNAMGRARRPSHSILPRSRAEQSLRASLDPARTNEATFVTRS